MPYKSQAQAGKFHELLKEGKISQATVDEFDHASKGMKLPERVAPKKKSATIKVQRLSDLNEIYKKKFGGK